jgi:DNA topoisomerase I
VDAATRERCAALVLPPAWTDVWICPWPNGHIQALGTDARGRRQYRYHPAWIARQAERKHDRVLGFAAVLPDLRKHVAVALAGEGLTRERVLACAIRLLDLGFFRVGTDEYAETNQTYGLATLRRDHVMIDDTPSGERLTFEYTAKSGKHRVQAIADPDVVQVVRELLDRDDENPELLAWWEDVRPRPGGLPDCPAGWHDVKAADINDRLRELTGLDVSAKDFRTWSATVLCAVGLAVSSPVAATPTARKRAEARAVAETAHYLGNTPAVCRASYIHPRLFDLFADRVTIAPVLRDLGTDVDAGDLAIQGVAERAVLELLTDPQAARQHARAEEKTLRRLVAAVSNG